MSPLDPTIRGVGAPRPAERTGPAAPARGTGQAGAPGFDALLASRLKEAAPQQGEALRWSAHARDRLAQRGIQVTPEVADRLQDAVGRAAAKGAREALVMVDDTAFVVSVKNRVVITAVDKEGMKNQVFTNIDSAVLAP
ncbi:MAG: flagellar biosynthesis protein [Thermoleophilia bacterium]|nr:flagellar biosynthesis protein [Thermoleophilia bacterium]